MRMAPDILTRSFSAQRVSYACHCVLHLCDNSQLLFACTCIQIKGETELPGKFDVIRIDLHPSEQYKSVSTHIDTPFMVLI